MSKVAPWIALAIDWDESEMFDGASEGAQLAWIKLMCYAKAQGRAGRVAFRIEAFCKRRKVSARSAQEMIAIAVAGGAIVLEGDTVTLLNWRSYQDPRIRKTGEESPKPDNDLRKDCARFTKTSGFTENDATQYPVPSTPNPVPSTSREASPRTPRFAKPTIEEVRAYCIERSNDVDPERFFNHYEANGWMVGKNPMRNWKAAIHGTWERGKPPPQAPPRQSAHRSDRIDPIAFRD